MTPLPSTFRKSGWDYKLISREDDVAVFEQTKPGVEDPRFEVVKVQSHGGFTINGKVVAPAEHMPSSEQWGIYGFTLTSREAAFKKVDEMAFL